MGVLNFLKIAFYVVTTIVGVKNFRTAKKLQDQGQDILATKTGQGGKIPIIYGRRRVGSTLLYMDTDSGNSKELFIIYGLCLGEVESIELDTIEINGVPLSDTKVFRDGYYTGSDKISSGAGSLNTVSQIGTSSGSFRGDGRSGTDPTKIYRMVLNAHHGADDQAVDPMLNASQSSKFTSNHRLRGIAYIAASFQYDEKGMFTSVPELTVVVKGRKLYDPRLDGSITGGTGSHRIDDPTTYEWSNNAALTLLDYMHQDYGKGLSTSSIDLQSFQTAANTADTIVDVPDYSGSYASATFSADVEDNFITVNEATWKKIKGGELLSVKDSGGSVIINQNNVIDSQRFTPHTESTNFRIYIDGVPPAKVSKSVTFSATNGDATITVSCTSHGASANDRVLFSGATSLGGNITATVLNKGYTIATVVDANSFTIEATDLNLTTVLANSSDTGNGGGGAVGKFMYADESGLFLAQTRRLQCDGVLDTNETVLDNARDLLSNMRGFLNYIDGKYSVLVEDATSSSFSITDDHIIDQGIKIRYEDKADKLNKVVVQFFNAQKKYESDTKTVFHNNSTSTYKNDDGGEELETTAEFQYITNPYNAFNMGKGILERSRRQKTISFIGTPRLLNLTAGDVVTITYTPYNLSNAAYRIETINLLDNGLVGIQAIEYFDLYTWSSTPPEENVGGEPDLPTGTEAEPPTNLTFTDATSTRRAFLTWTAATNYPAKEFRVIIKNSSGQEIHNRIVSDAFIDLDFIAVANGYVASITSISSTGAESSATSITFNVTQQPVKLGDIQANAITANEINVTDLSAISADLGSITAGSINIGSGAFTVSSSGVMTATGATVSGAITASSLNVTGATVTGTIDASKITLNGDPLTDIFALAGSGTAQTLSLGPDNKNLLKVDGIQLKYFAFDLVQNQGTEVLQMDLDDLELFNTRLDHKQTTIKSEGSIVLSSISSPSSTSNKLYNVGGSLHFNGTALGTGTGDITEVVAGTNLNGGGSSGSVTLNLDSTITGNHTFSNNLTVGGDLTVQGTTTTIDTTNLEVKDKNITLNYSTGDSSANANGAGITIQDAVDASTDATILWNNTNDRFAFSHSIILPDDEKLQFGASNDLQIFHQTSNGNSIIKESGGGILSFQTNGAEVSIFDTANSQNMARFITGADVRLFHNGTVKLATSSSGVEISGDITISDATPTLTFTDTDNNYDATIAGLSGSLVLTADSGAEFGTETIQFHTGGSQRATFDSSGNLGIGTASPSSKLHISNNAAPGDLTLLTLQNGNSTGDISTPNTYIDFQFKDSNSNVVPQARIGAHAGDGTDANTQAKEGKGYLTFHTSDTTNTSGTEAPPERMRIAHDGDVGIGTASPSSILHVVGGSATIPTLSSSFPFTISNNGNSGMNIISSGTTNAGQINFGDEGDADAGILRYDHNDNSMRFTTNASEAMRIDSSGNVGVGSSSPSSKLTVAGDIEQTTGDLKYTGGINWDIAHHGASQNIVFSTTPSGGSATERMRIRHDGRVGIGTASPSAPLHVVGNSYVQSGTLFTDAITAYSGSSISINAGSSHLAATVNGSERMRIASNGSIAIGHTSPSSTFILDVNGQIRSFGNSPAFNLREDDSSNQHWQIGSYSGSFAVRNVTGSSYPLTINTSGDATFAGNVTAYSDERLKENIQTLDGKKALQMRGVSFTKDGREGSGVIAQEIEKIAPELVLTADDEQGTKSVAYGNLVGYLIEAIKDQQVQIDELKAKLDGSS
tara:strand:+ start:5384 stop:10621 length:5238 start_codon:yes stop_codon:yes gene_type:complete